MPTDNVIPLPADRVIERYMELASRAGPKMQKLIESHQFGPAADILNRLGLGLMIAVFLYAEVEEDNVTALCGTALGRFLVTPEQEAALRELAGDEAPPIAS